MTNQHHRLRACVLGIALAMAIPPAFATPATDPGVSSTPDETRYSIASLQSSHTYDRFIVTYRKDSSERGNHAAAIQNVDMAIERAGLNRITRSVQGAGQLMIRAEYQRKLAVGADLVRTSRKLNADQAAALIRQIAADPAVEYVEPDAIMHPIDGMRTPTQRVRAGQAAATRAATPSNFPEDAPDDPKYNEYQWDFFNASGGANVPPAWSLADGTDVVVAVLDTGLTANADIDYSLADAGYDFLSDKAYSGRDSDGRAAGGWDLGDWTEANECDNGSPAGNSSWHGTHVSGTIAALTDNGVALAGMAGQAKVLPVRVLGHCGGPVSDITDDLVWAAGGHIDGIPDNPNPAKVINMSLGGQGYCYADSAFATAIGKANDLGATVVVAAGNDGTNTENAQPASCPGVITVAATGIDGGKAQYSNFGTAVALAAPGGGICPDDKLPDSSGTCGGTPPAADGFVWSLVNSGTTTPQDDVGEGSVYFAGMAGTSQATPHVTATVALVLDAMRTAGMDAPTPDQIRGFLVDSVRSFPIMPPSGEPIGPGILDAAAAINLALGNDEGDVPVALDNGVPVHNLYGEAGDTMLFTLEVPEGARNLSLRSFGGMGDVSIYVGVNRTPTADAHDFASTRAGNNESVVLRSPAPGTYTILMTAGDEHSFRGVSMLGNYAK